LLFNNVIIKSQRAIKLFGAFFEELNFSILDFAGDILHACHSISTVQQNYVSRVEPHNVINRISLNVYENLMNLNLSIEVLLTTVQRISYLVTSLST
jgi:hypothetical protein